MNESPVRCCQNPVYENVDKPASLELSKPAQGRTNRALFALVIIVCLISILALLLTILSFVVKTGSSNEGSDSGKRIKALEEEVAELKATLDKAGKPSGFAMLDSNGSLPQSLLVAGYDKYSLYDLGWQSLHMGAASACRGSISSGSYSKHQNAVLVRNSDDKKSCAELCAKTAYSNCDGEVSIYGKIGKATKNGEMVGAFYNYTCDGAIHGGSEVSRSVSDITRFQDQYQHYSFCCCRDLTSL